MGTIYRIQSKINRGRGPYYSHTTGETGEGLSEVVKRLLKEHSDWDDHKHPPPEADKGIERRIGDNEYCGFVSAAKLLRWFRGFIPDLLRAGYEIVALNDITATAIGEFQVVFKWNN